MAEQVRCGDREFRQVPRGQGLPPLPVPGEPVDGQDLYRSWRAVAVDVQIGHDIDVMGCVGHLAPVGRSAMT